MTRSKFTYHPSFQGRLRNCLTAVNIAMHIHCDNIYAFQNCVKKEANLSFPSGINKYLLINVVKLILTETMQFLIQTAAQYAAELDAAETAVQKQMCRNRCECRYADSMWQRKRSSRSMMWDIA